MLRKTISGTGQPRLMRRDTAAARIVRFRTSSYIIAVTGTVVRAARLYKFRLCSTTASDKPFYSHQNRSACIVCALARTHTHMTLSVARPSLSLITRTPPPFHIHIIRGLKEKLIFLSIPLFPLRYSIIR